MFGLDPGEQLIVKIYENLSPADKLNLSETCWMLRQCVFYPTLWRGYNLSLVSKSGYDGLTEQQQEQRSAGAVSFFNQVGKLLHPRKLNEIPR
jgi:hypothetical protein